MFNQVGRFLGLALVMLVAVPALPVQAGPAERLATGGNLSHDQFTGPSGS